MSRRITAVLGSAAFLALAPGCVAGLVPWWITGWKLGPPWLGLAPVRIAGAAMIVLACAVLLECFTRFAWVGRGTPAPVAPTERLVVTGLYRYVRNPMYVAVTSAIAGQALLFASGALAAYGAAVWLGFHTFVLLYEEPALRRRYGAEYRAYCCEVRRWIPRLTPYGGAAR